MLMDGPYLSRISDNSYDHSRLEKFKSYNSKTWSYKSYDTCIIIYYRDNANRVFNGLALLHLSFTEPKVRI
jgi:hypothetical protein